MTLDHLSAEEITSFVDGECGDLQTQHIADHLALCEDCRLVADDERRIKAILGTMPEPELPRSFLLTPQMAPTVAPLASPDASPRIAANTSKYEPILRFLSIAAVLALLVLGGAQIAGIGVDDQQNTSNQPALTETDASNSALEEQDSSIARGEVRTQGESAAAGAGPLNAQHVVGDTPAQATDSGLTPIEITTIGVGVVALASIAGWILIRYRAGETSHQM